MSTESNTAAFAAIVRTDASTGAVLPSVADVRIEAGLEALSENTRRAYAVALRAWGLWAAVHRHRSARAVPSCVSGLSPGTGRGRRRPALVAPGGGCAALNCKRSRVWS